MLPPAHVLHLQAYSSCSFGQQQPRRTLQKFPYSLSSSLQYIKLCCYCFPPNFVIWNSLWLPAIKMESPPIYPHQFPFPLVVKHPATLCAVYVNMATEMCFKKCSVSRIQHGLWHLEVEVQDWDLSDAWKTYLSLLSSRSRGVAAGTGIGTEASPSKLETVTGFWTQITQITQIAYIDVVKTDIGSLIHKYCLHILFAFCFHIFSFFHFSFWGVWIWHRPDLRI